MDCTTHKLISIKYASASGFVIIESICWMSPALISSCTCSSVPFDREPAINKQYYSVFDTTQHDFHYLPSTIAVSYRMHIGICTSLRMANSRGTMPCDITDPFCLSLPIIAFFKQIKDSCILAWSGLYNSSMYDREFSTS